jgi:hypothetical protein
MDVRALPFVDLQIDELCALLAPVLGDGDIASVSRVDGGLVNTTYRVVPAGKRAPVALRIYATCALALLAQACAGRDSASAGDTSPARAGATDAATAATCGVDAHTTLTGDGIGALRVGTPVDDIARACRVMRDATVPGPEGTTERRIVVDLGRDSVSAVIDAGRVWRVHVRTPTFRTTDSLGVGTPGPALRRPGAQVLSGEGAVFVGLPSHCGLSFRLRGVEFGRVATPAQIPDTAVVDEVLAIGCSGSRR